MARKAVTTGGTRDEIIRVAKGLFFEKGFDGVTIRTIQREVGCEVGLFYYYFRSKDQVFDVVMSELQEEWRQSIDGALQEQGDDWLERLIKVLQCVYAIAKDFRADKAEALHWSVQGALYNRLAAVAEGFIAEILGDSKTAVNIDNKALAAIIAGGMCRFVQTTSDWEYFKAGDGIESLIEGIYGDRKRNADSIRRREISVELL